MKKAIIFALVAFLLSTGATTAILVKTHTPLPAPVDSVKAAPDSARAATASTAKPAPDSLTPDSAHAPARPDSAPVHHDSAVAATIAPLPAGPVIPAAVHHVADVDPAAKAAAYKQVARVLSAMKPVEAAKVLAYLSDDEVEGLLRAVGPRQAADFLTNIPKERAAGLSRRLLVPKAETR